MARIRLDKMVLKRNFAETQEEALRLIESGNIFVNGSVQKSAHSFVDSGSAIELAPSKPQYVSRGGLKLERALAEFEIDPFEKRCLDIGASTGGFTDCLLQKGASHVVALDVGHGQIDSSFRQDARVTVLEKTNAKDIDVNVIGGICQLGVMDVSFTSVSRLLEPVARCLEPKELVVLIKPQFECEPKYVDSRGIVKDQDAQVKCIEKIRDSLPLNLELVGLIASPIKGAKGNIEFLAHLSEPQNHLKSIDSARIDGIVRNAVADLES